MREPPVATREGFLEIAPHRLEFAWHGDPASRALVFLHEGLGCAALWRDFPGKLARASGLSAFVYSRPNYGRSDASAPPPRPVRYMHDEALLLPQVLGVAGIPDPILVGHSDGASIAVLHAAAVPVRGLVLEAPHVFAEEHGLRSIARAREAYLNGDLRARLAKYHRHVDAAFWGWNGPWLDPAFRQWNLESSLPAIRSPTLLVQGEEDEYGTVAQIDALQRGLGGPVETLLVPGAGHAPHKEREGPVLQAMGRFVRSLA